ncbi:hypothetical protein Gpo141_00011107 [Globisporangium polare]
MLAMAAGRTSNGGGAGGGSGSQWSSTRTRVSVSARGSPSAGAAVAVGSSSQDDHEELLSSGGSGITGTSLSANTDHDQGDDGDARMLTTSSAYKSESEDEYEDEDEWEDVGNDLPVFRDCKFPEPAGDAEDSEYAPSENEDDDVDGQQPLSDEELYASDLEVEEEESSVAGLFASVVRQLGTASTKRRGKAASSSNAIGAEDSPAFTEQDKDFWATPEEKQQWVARFDAANKQFVHRYGCRIDSPAHPEAKAKLRREKKKKNVYALILFALCVAYLVQLIALSTNTVLSVADSVKKLANGLPHPTDVYESVLGKISSLLPPPEKSGSELRAPAAMVTITETVEPVDEQATQYHDAEDNNSEIADAALASIKDATSAEPPHLEEEELDYAKVAVQLCSKLLNRLVKSKYDQEVKDGAIRACDAAIVIAPRESAHWIEAHVLRGDLWSLVSEFDAANEDYKGAAAAIVTTGPSLQEPSRLALSQEIQAKILTNQWINLFTKNKYKELRQEVGKVSKDGQQSAQLRALATDWLLVFKKKKQPFEVLTATRLWTLQRLEYA